MDLSKFGYSKEALENVKILVAFTRAEKRLHGKEYKTILGHGVTISQFSILELLYHHGSMKICEIIERVLTTSGNITVIIKNLEKNGLVKKSQVFEDKRAFLIEITEKGSSIVTKIMPKHHENINNIFSKLTDMEKNTFLKILKKI